MLKKNSIIVVLSCCLLIDCGKYQHSDKPPKYYDTKNVDELSEEDRAAIEEEEQFAKKSKNIEIQDVIRRLEKLKYKNQSKEYIHSFEKNGIRVEMTSKDPEKCSSILVYILPNYFEKDNSEELFESTIHAIVNAVDEKTEEDEVKQLYAATSKIKQNQVKDMVLGERLQVTLQKGSEKNSELFLTIKKKFDK